MGLRKGPPTQKSHQHDGRRAKNLEERTVIVNGEEEQIMVPPSSHMPKEIKWDAQKIRVAEHIADGIPLLTISKMEGMPQRPVIHGWLHHPEFAKYVEELVLQTGVANRIIRIAASKRVTEALARKFEEQLDNVELTDKNVASLINTYFGGLKQINEEVRGYDQVVKVEADQKVEATVTNLDLENLMQSTPDDVRARLQEEFAKKADAIIRGLEP